jgi:hypothetical protein
MDAFATPGLTRWSTSPGSRTAGISEAAGRHGREPRVHVIGRSGTQGPNALAQVTIGSAAAVPERLGWM